RYAIEDESTEYEEKEELVELSQLDTSYFAELTRGIHKEKEQLEKSLATYLRDGWSFDRFDGTLRALLLCAAYELVHTDDVDAAVIVKEYVDLAYAFFNKNEPKMVNALLDQISKAVR
ncbi:MAG: transcription antitermination factor NusB, partial [Alphaproteobacteria bacterium]|nr:transcription antitermination factor NusB [Alphaproteobacteria bacterium]